MNTQKNDPVPVLGSFSATCVVVGAIVGIGIFFTPRNVAQITGSSSLALITWMIGGFIAMVGALTYAELGGRCTRNGGQYEILRDAWSPSVGFAYVFCNATIIQAGAIAIIAYIAAKNLGVFIHGDVLSNNTNFSIGAVMIVGLTLANAVGVRWGSGIQNTTVVAKITTLLLITLLAVFAPDPAAADPGEEAATALAATSDASPLALIFAGLIPVFFSFGGWQHALWIGGEVRNPRRNIPLAIVLGLVIVTITYLAANWAYFRLLGFNGVAGGDAIAAEAVATIWPGFGGRIVAAAIAISGFGVLNAQLLCGPRLINGMARQGKFFSVFTSVSPTTRTPIPAVFMLGGLGLAILLLTWDSERIDSLLNGVVLVDAVFFFLTGLAIFRLRQLDKAAGTTNTGFQVPWYPWIPCLFVIGEILVLSGAFMVEKYRNGAWIGLSWIAAALICYAIFFRHRSSGNDQS